MIILPACFGWTMIVRLTVLSFLLSVVYAPFPPEHPYHWANPLIDPWWHELSPEVFLKYNHVASAWITCYLLLRLVVAKNNLRTVEEK